MQYSFRQLYEADLCRNAGNRYVRKLLKYFRLCQTTHNTWLLLLYQYVFKKIKESHHIEIPATCHIGPGLYLGHPYGITINSEAVIGANCNIHKGVSIGQENRGKRKGVPTIGNNVYIGINAIIVGKIHIGDDVLIAPNSYVNCDVPSHSIVLGNPCIIKAREGATDGYINNKCIV